MNSGVTMNRVITGNEASERRVAVHAAIGAANANPVSTATGIIARPPTTSAAWNRIITSTNAVATSVSRIANQNIWPITTSSGRTGVATMAWKVRSHTIPAISG